MNFTERVAVVTGAGSSIGEATAHLLAAGGAHVVVVDVRSEAAKAVANTISAEGGQALPKAFNVADRDEVRNGMSDVLAQLGRIDILVNNAGALRDRQIKNVSRDEWRQVLSVNLGGTWNCTLAALTAMEEQGYGKIVSVSSRASLGNFGQTNYASSKARIVGMARALALEKGPYGININAVAPGYVETPMTTGASPEVRDRALKATPLQRLGKPIDLARPIAFLCSDEASYIPGQCLFVCGDRSIKAARENWGQ